jgi:hypothetical protein
MPRGEAQRNSVEIRVKEGLLGLVNVQGKQIRQKLPDVSDGVIARGLGDLI